LHKIFRGWYLIFSFWDFSDNFEMNFYLSFSNYLIEFTSASIWSLVIFVGRLLTRGTISVHIIDIHIVLETWTFHLSYLILLHMIVWIFFYLCTSAIISPILFLVLVTWVSNFFSLLKSCQFSWSFHTINFWSHWLHSVDFSSMLHLHVLFPSLCYLSVQLDLLFLLNFFKMWW
jgi:hypothetical protein